MQDFKNDDCIMTPFDRMTCPKELQLAKLLLPYLPPKNQRMFAIYIKFSEFQHTLSHFQNFNHAYSDFSDFINTLKSYLPEDAFEQFENLQNAIQMMQMMQSMQEMQENDFDPSSMMKDMLTPEQQDLFQMYQNVHENQEGESEKND